MIFSEIKIAIMVAGKCEDLSEEQCLAIEEIADKLESTAKIQFAQSIQDIRIKIQSVTMVNDW